MRSTHALSLSFLALTATTLQTDYGRERALRVSAVTELSMETVSFSMEIDGEPVDRGWGGGGSSSETREVVLVHRVLEREDGAPIAVSRTFETVAGSSSREFGEETLEEEREGPLASCVVEFRLDDDEVVAEVVEGDGLDDETLLAGWSLELTLDALLPEGDVEAGDEWELSQEQASQALSLALARALLPPDPEAERGERGGGRGRGGRRGGSAARMLEAAEWEGTATFLGKDELDGESVLIVEIALEASGELEETRGGGRGGRAPRAFPRPLESSFEAELEGRLAFSPERACVVQLELEGTLSTDRVTERERPDGGTMVIESAQEGTLTLTVTVTEEEAQ